MLAALGWTDIHRREVYFWTIPKKKVCVCLSVCGFVLNQRVVYIMCITAFLAENSCLLLLEMTNPNSKSKGAHCFWQLRRKLESGLTCAAL